MIVAIDPGDVHVGIAVQIGGDAISSSCVTPEEATTWAERNFERARTIIIESFVLYPWASAGQSWSEMKTPKLIGALEYIAARAEVQVVFQNATIKKPTEGHLRAHGIKITGNRHAKDAQLHLYHFLFKGGGL